MYICKDILHIIHMPDVEKLQISPHLSCGEILNYSTCGEILDFSTFVMHINLKFLHMTIFLHISNLWYLWQISGMCKRWDEPFLKNITRWSMLKGQKDSGIIISLLNNWDGCWVQQVHDQHLMVNIIWFMNIIWFIWFILWILYDLYLMVNII